MSTKKTITVKNKLIKFVLVTILGAGVSFLFAQDEKAKIDFDGEVSVRPELSMYPCTDCHDGSVNKKIRKLEDEHGDIELKHHQEGRWCLDCHNPTKRDFLKLSNGDLVPFEKSFRLCGQCHGKIYKEWKIGVHGKKLGKWTGEATYIHCTNCHNPHNPKFKPLEPKPRPRKPTEINAHDPSTEKSQKSEKKEEKK
ncbi:MAG: cytochrome c3 family protein [Spirochaetia bacterium]|nr:cytochrome c3 family protein [Spirochaetia bacterium]